jgi:TonB family protein
MLASELGPELPRQSFAEWLGKTVRQTDDAIVWQLTECGDQIEGAPNEAGNPRACVEANTILTDGRRLIVRVAVGTFKQGMTGSPSFQFGVIDQQGELRQIRRLRDLQPLLLNPDKLSKSPAAKLPDLSADSERLALNNVNLPIRLPLPLTSNGEDGGQLDLDSPPPKPPERSQGGVQQGAPKFKPMPAYPRNNNAKRFNAAGKVEVQVTISVTGRVTDAKAISGHPLLREAALEAARRWLFEPTLADGVPKETQLTLTFEFTVPPQ